LGEDVLDHTTWLKAEHDKNSHITIVPSIVFGKEVVEVGAMHE
jgi:hypothetical protein